MSRRSVAAIEAEPPAELQMASAVDPRRLAVIEEAWGWLRTPYHHMGRVRGAGTDCLMLLAEVYERAKVVPHIATCHSIHLIGTCIATPSVTSLVL